MEAKRPEPEGPDREKWLRRLAELVAYDLHRRQLKTKPQLAVELIEQMEASAVAPDVYGWLIVRRRDWCFGKGRHSINDRVHGREAHVWSTLPSHPVGGVP